MSKTEKQRDGFLTWCIVLTWCILAPIPRFSPHDWVKPESARIRTHADRLIAESTVS